MHISLGMHIIHCLLFQNGAAPLVFRHVALTSSLNTLNNHTYSHFRYLTRTPADISGLLFPPPMNKLRQVVKSYIKACSPLFFHTVNGDNTKHVA